MILHFIDFLCMFIVKAKKLLPFQQIRHSFRILPFTCFIDIHDIKSQQNCLGDQRTWDPYIMPQIFLKNKIF